MLRCVIYISRSRLGPNPTGIAEIVAASSRRNAEAGVTGVLWADDRHFAQVIEGDPEAIEQTIGRIRSDARHADIEVLFDRQVSSSQFGQWSMREAADDDQSALGSAFIIGFALSLTTAPAARLYQIVLASDGQGK